MIEVPLFDSHYRDYTGGRVELKSVWQPAARLTQPVRYVDILPRIELKLSLTSIGDRRLEFNQTGEIPIKYWVWFATRNGHKARFLAFNIQPVPDQDLFFEPGQTKTINYQILYPLYFKTYKRGLLAETGQLEFEFDFDPGLRHKFRLNSESSLRLEVSEDYGRNWIKPETHGLPPDGQAASSSS